MEFEKFNKLLQNHVATMVADTTHLFTVEPNTDVLWNLYLDSFPPGTNEVYRQRREYDCSCCRHFIRDFGGVVAIKNGKLITAWDFQTGDATFQPVVDALAAFVRGYAVANVLVTDTAKFGTKTTHESLDDGSVKAWNHFFVELPASFVTRIGNSTLDTVKGRLRDVRNVFKRSLDTITEDAVLTVLELIAQNTLYKGEEWKGPLQVFRDLQKAYALATDKELFAWEQSVKINAVVGKIRNHSIGTLLTDISEGVDLDNAVRKYEAVVAPENYKRPKAIFTKKMLDEAQKTLEGLGLIDSLPRRHARLDDITVNNVLFANRDAAKRVGGVFEDMAKQVAPKKLDKVEEITIEKFVADVLPTATGIEVLFENRLTKNLVSLIAPVHKDAPSLLKWDNGFSWAYKDNVADSMKEQVKAAGGKVDGELRFSIRWNEDGKSIVDFDAHAKCPGGVHIHFGDKKPHGSNGGFLDVDMISPRGIGVENITWPTGTKMKPGVYLFSNHNISGHRNHTGFDAEIEFNGEIHYFRHREAFTGTVDVARVTVDADGSYSIESMLPSNKSTAPGKEVWGVTTNQFVPVSVCSFSPNFWDGQTGIGHRHYFFMLKGCVNDESPNGFFNEFLREEFMVHKRVFEALGSRMRVEPAADQLSGLGFSSTKRDSLTVKVEGRFTRLLKITF